MSRLFENQDINRRFGRGQWRMLTLTIVGYTLFYFLRKNFSFAMPGLEQDLGVSKSMLGNCLMAGGIVYGISKFLNGFIGDRVKAKRLFCLGLVVCALVNVAFGFAPEIAAWFAGGASGALGDRALPAACEFGGRGATALPAAGTVAVVLGVLYVVNQFFQGMGFPPCAKLIAHWIPPKELATKMSVWNTSHSIGGGLVAKICGVIMGFGVVGAANQGVGMWRWCFWAMAIAGFAGFVAMWFGLPGTPEEEGLPPVPGTETAPTGGGRSSPECAGGQRGCSDAHRGEMRPREKSWSTVFSNPAIWILGFANFTINASRALVADWGPTMLQEAKGLASGEAGTVIMLFEFAGIAGMLFAGWATDRWAGGRSPRVCLFAMALAALALFGFWVLPAGLCSGAAMCAFGFLLYGPQALTGVAATNLCGKRFAGTSIGFISLFSYVGVSLSGKLCGTLAQSSGGWQIPVWAIVGTTLAGAAFFLPLWRAKANNYAG